MLASCYQFALVAVRNVGDRYKQSVLSAVASRGPH